MLDNSYMMEMKDAKTVFAENLTMLMANNQHSQGFLHKKTGLSQSTIGRAMKGEVSPTVDTVETIAKFYGLQAWQMFIMNMDASNPPVLQMSKQEREFYENIKNAAREIAKYSGD